MEANPCFKSDEGDVALSESPSHHLGYLRQGPLVASFPLGEQESMDVCKVFVRALVRGASDTKSDGAY